MGAMMDGFRAVIQDARAAAAAPPPRDAAPQEHLRFLTAAALSAMLTWRFLAVFVAISLAAWWLER